MGNATVVIFMCSRCSGLFMASAVQKSRTCPYCGTRVDLRKAKRVASSNSAFEASEKLRKMKSQQGNAKWQRRL
jgi:DNA-directed RNA polymerase subunit RPC12/RpoP